MAFDFGTLGNHEFNYGLPYLKDTFTQTLYPNIYENDIFSQQILSRNQYQPMGLLLANHVIEQDRRQYDQSFKIDNGDFCKGHHFVIT